MTLGKTAATVKTDSKGEKVTCLLCGKYYHRLDVHVSAAHGVNINAYKEQFPGAPTISDSAREAASRSQQGREIDITGAPRKSIESPELSVEEEQEDKDVYKIGVARLRLRTDIQEHEKVHVPEHDNGWVFDTSNMDQWEDIAMGIEDNQPIFIGGPTGCGKTASIYQLGAALNQPVRRIQLNRDFKVGEFVGRATLETGEDGSTITSWKDGVLTEAMREGWWLLLDEMDQAHPDVLMKIQGVLEGAPLVLTENFGEVVKPSDNFRLIATANTFGRGDESGLYAGAKVMNEATLDRFGVVIKADYPAAQTEKDILVKRTGINLPIAKKMIEVAHKVREALAKEECMCTFSTRRLIGWASKTVRFKGNVRRAAQTSVINKLDSEDANFVNSLIQRYFGGDF